MIEKKLLLIQRFLILLLLFMFSLSNVACGRKSAPDRPDGSEYPRVYPSR